MVLAAPGPLLTPPPSSSPPKTPHRSYSSQTRSQDEEKNPPPQPYLPPQTRTRHRLPHRPHVPTLMRGNTPPTTRSPPHQSPLTGNPPNLQPVTVSEEERGGRDPTSRRTLMRAAPDCRPPPTTPHALQPRSRSTSHPPQQQDAVHRELRPGTGKGARAGAGLKVLCTPGPGSKFSARRGLPSKGEERAPHHRPCPSIDLDHALPGARCSTQFYAFTL
jgi:hypothetical protein